MLEVIIAVAAAILLGNILAHRMRVPPAVLLIFLGLMLALIPAHQLNEVREVGLPPHVILEIFLPVMLFWPQDENLVPLEGDLAVELALFC